MIVAALSCFFSLAGCGDADLHKTAHAAEARLSLADKGYPLNVDESKVLHALLAGKISTKNLASTAVVVSDVTAETIEKLVSGPESLVLLQGKIASYEYSPDGKSVYLYFSQTAEGKNEVSSVAWVSMPNDGIKRQLKTGEWFDVYCADRAYIVGVARFFGCIPRQSLNEMIIEAYKIAIMQHLEERRVEKEIAAPLVAIAISLASDEETIETCFSMDRKGIDHDEAAFNCLRNSDAFSHAVESAADTLKANDLAVFEDSATFSMAKALTEQIEAILPVAPAPSYQMTDLEAQIFKAWLYNDLTNWVEAVEAGEVLPSYAEHIPVYFGFDDLSIVSAQELENAYYENEVAADLRFLDKKLLVHGKIRSINSGLKNKPSVTFATNDRFTATSASFREPDLSIIAQLKRGQSIRLFCMGAGEVVGSPRLSNCEFADEVLKLTLEANFRRIKSLLSDKPQELADYEIGVYALSVAQARALPEDSICASSDELKKCAELIGKSRSDKVWDDKEQMEKQMVVRGAGSGRW